VSRAVIMLELTVPEYDKLRTTCARPSIEFDAISKFTTDRRRTCQRYEPMVIINCTEEIALALFAVVRRKHPDVAKTIARAIRLAKQQP
jgi:hypothetical protein